MLRESDELLTSALSRRVPRHHTATSASVPHLLPLMAEGGAWQGDRQLAAPKATRDAPQTGPHQRMPPLPARSSTRSTAGGKHNLPGSTRRVLASTQSSASTRRLQARFPILTTCLRSRRYSARLEQIGLACYNPTSRTTLGSLTPLSRPSATRLKPGRLGAAWLRVGSATKGAASWPARRLRRRPGL